MPRPVREWVAGAVARMGQEQPSLRSPNPLMDCRTPRRARVAQNAARDAIAGCQSPYTSLKWAGKKG